MPFFNFNCKHCFANIDIFIHYVSCEFPLKLARLTFITILENFQGSDEESNKNHILYGKYLGEEEGNLIFNWPVQVF